MNWLKRLDRGLLPLNWRMGVFPFPAIPGRFLPSPLAVLAWHDLPLHQKQQDLTAGFLLCVPTLHSHLSGDQTGIIAYESY
ncbi:hypothetical protein ANAEL_04520 [Anaerolineales bacterium]|nr:hypothetical protein ANAEL_04520 [Anaerolineales bacterium]